MYRLISLFVAVIFVLDGCAREKVRGLGFHLEVANGPQARPKIVQFGRAISGFGPMLFYDARRGVLNGFVHQPASLAVIEAAGRQQGLKPQAGFDHAPAGFLAQLSCSRERPCSVDADAQCTVVGQISEVDRKQHFDAFSTWLMYGGYPVLGVLFDRQDPNSVQIKVPLYADCDDAETEISSAWHESGASSDVVFQRLPAVSRPQR
jgi:hypothetical protein